MRTESRYILVLVGIPSLDVEPGMRKGAEVFSDGTCLPPLFTFKKIAWSASLLVRGLGLERGF
jgi:hypothetical protein